MRVETVEKVEKWWKQFLVEARHRFDQALAESVRDCAALLGDADRGEAGIDPARVDASTITRAWTAAQVRVQGLRAKVDEVWREQVRPSYEATGDFRACEVAAGQAEALDNWMEIEIQRAETALLAELAGKLLDAAQAEAAARICTGCGVALGRGPGVCARELPCPRCAAVNHVEPSPAAKMVVELGPHLWREACWDLWLTKHQAEQLVRRSDEPTLAQLKAWEQAEIDYLCGWMRERAGLLAALGVEVRAVRDAELERQLESFYAGLEREAVWTAAGRPRAQVADL